MKRIFENAVCIEKPQSDYGRGRSNFYDAMKFSVLLPLREATSKIFEVFEMCLYRRIMQVSWMERVTNAEIVLRIYKEREIINTIKYLGLITRHFERYHLLQGKVLRK